MRGITKTLTGLTLAAGLLGAGTAFAMGDGYMTEYYGSPGATYSYDTTYSYESPTYTPYGSYSYAPYGTYGYAPYSTGYYDNPYNPYWSYRGPLGQGSGSDMRIGR